MKIATVQHFKASNDVNGNARRVFLVTEVAHEGGQPSVRIVAHDEGHTGSKPVTDGLRARGYSVVEVEPVNVSVKEYRNILKAHGKGRFYK